MTGRAKKRLRCVLMLSAGIPLLLFILYGCRSICITAPEPLPVKARPVTARVPLTADELAALRWLDHVLGPLPEAEERKWRHKGHQFGLTSTRYHLAFATPRNVSIALSASSRRQPSATAMRTASEAFCRS